MKIGAQLYTVHDYTKTLPQFAEVLKRVADIGYTSVQVSGTCAYAPEWLAEELARNGLTCDLTHTPFPRMAADPGTVAAEHKLFGCKYIGVGSMPDLWQTGFAAYAPFKAALPPVLKRFRELGCKFMYHNHAREFEIGDGKNVMQHLAEDFQPEEFGFTLDTYWVKVGGDDPVAWLQRLPGQLDCIHLKDLAHGPDGKPRFAPVGYGTLDFDAILAAAQASGTEFAFVEQDDCNGEDPFDCLAKSYRYLIGKGLK